MQNSNAIGQINAFAMQNGVVLGLWGMASLAAFRWSFVYPLLSTVFGLMLLAGPVVATVLTLRFRHATAPPSEAFGFMPGFLHTLFVGFYASVWIALGTFVYLQYFDHGTVFAAYAKSLERPEMQAYLQQSGMAVTLDEMTGGRGVQGLAEVMQSIGAANYAAMSLYVTMIFGPVISALVGLVCRRNGRA